MFWNNFLVNYDVNGSRVMYLVERHPFHISRTRYATTIIQWSMLPPMNGDQFALIIIHRWVIYVLIPIHTWQVGNDFSRDSSKFNLQNRSRRFDVIIQQHQAIKWPEISSATSMTSSGPETINSNSLRSRETSKNMSLQSVLCRLMLKVLQRL